MRGNIRKRNKKKNILQATTGVGQGLPNINVTNQRTITLGEFLMQWLETYARHNTRPTTYAGYETFIRRHILPEIGDIELGKLTALDLQQLYAQKTVGGRADGQEGGLSTRSVRLIHSIVREALNHAMKWRLISQNAALDAVPPKNRSRKTGVWSAEQVVKFLESIKNHRLYVMYLLALIEKAGLPRITFHDLRRTHATLLIAGGADPRQVADRIGHSSLTVTLGIYNQVTRGRQEETAKLIDEILFH